MGELGEVLDLTPEQGNLSSGAPAPMAEASPRICHPPSSLSLSLFRLGHLETWELGRGKKVQYETKER